MKRATEKHRPKVFLIGECFSDNLGDQLIANAASESFASLGWAVEKIYFSKPRQNRPRTPDPTKIIKKNFSLTECACVLDKAKTAIYPIKWLLVNFFYIYNKVDMPPQLAIIGGGQLVLSNNIFPVAMFVWSMVLKIKKIPYIIVSVGAGQRFKKGEKWLLSKSLNAAQSVYARDLESIRLLKEYFGVEAKFIPDLAYAVPIRAKSYVSGPIRSCLLCPPAFEVYCRYACEMEHKNITHEEYRAWWVWKANDLLERGYLVKLGWSTLADKVESIFIKEELPNCTFAFDDCNLGNFISAACACDHLISGRMHGLIIGHLVGCQIEPYIISKKIEAFVSAYLVRSPEDLCAEVSYILKGISNEYRNRHG